MKHRYGKYIIKDPSVLALLQEKDKAMAASEERRFAYADYADSILAQHQPYSSGNHNGGFDLSTAPTKDLAQRLTKDIGKGLWCNYCRNPWPCRMVGPLRNLASGLRYISDEIPAPLPAPEGKRIIKVSL